MRSGHAPPESLNSTKRRSVDSNRSTAVNFETVIRI
jgi:hypothetical protein